MSVYLLNYLLTRVSCAKRAEPIEMPFVRQTHVGPRNLVLDGGPDALTGRGTFERDIYRPIVMYLHMTAFPIVHLPLLAVVLTQCTWRTTADKTVM